MEIYVLMKKGKSSLIKKIEDIKDSEIISDVEWLKREALVKNIDCSKIVIITKKVWKDIIKLTNPKTMTAELTAPNLEYFEFLNDSNIIYYNVFKSGDSFPNIILNSYQHQLF
jgi:hypothetical protein